MTTKPRFSGTLIEDEPAPAAVAPMFSGTLIEDDVPASVPASERSHGALNAAARGLVDGVPIVGPALLGGIDRADAAVRALTNDSRYSDEVAKAQAYGADVAHVTTIG